MGHFESNNDIKTNVVLAAVAILVMMIKTYGAVMPVITVATATL